MCRKIQNGSKRIVHIIVTLCRIYEEVPTSKRFVVSTAAGALVTRSVMEDVEGNTLQAGGQSDGAVSSVRPSVAAADRRLDHGGVARGP